VRVARNVVLGAAALVAVSATACSSSHPAAVPGTSVTTASSVGTAPSTSAALTTTTTATPTPTTEALIPQQSPDVAARALFDAWAKGDRVAALHVATPAAAEALFARPVASYSDRGCQDPISDRALCAFGVGDGLAQVGTVSLAGGWVVERVTFE